MESEVFSFDAWLPYQCLQHCYFNSSSGEYYNAVSDRDFAD